MTDRIPCCVPFCNCSKVGPPEIVEYHHHTVWYEMELSQWVCSKHWRMVPPKMRSMFNEAKRRFRKRKHSFALKVTMRMWTRCRDAAIKKAMEG